MPEPDAFPPGTLPQHPVPRPEHPRPDFRRAEWQTLNGAWEFAFDPEGRGLQEGWERSGRPFPDRIAVPFPWESPAAWGEAGAAGEARFWHERAFLEPVPAPGTPVLDGEWRRAHARARRQEVGWYRRTLRVPAAWRAPGRRVYLCVGAADWETRVWCNGAAAGAHEGGYTPFAVELTPFLGPAGGEDVVVLRVYDPADNGEQPGGKQHGWYERTSGIWQPVWLECRPEAHLTHLRVEPDVQGRRALVEVGLSAVAGVYEVRVTARSPRGEAFSAAGTCPGCERRRLELPLGPHPDLWSPERPALYDLTVEVAAADGTDTVHSWFGMRSVGTGTLPGTDTPCLTLNGEPLYVRAALHQSFHPAGIYAYVDDAVIAADLRAAKAAGLNAVRLHIKVDDPRVYAWADRLGLGVLYDLPNTAIDAPPTPRARRLWEETLRGAVERDANHPSILCWVLFNETWGLGRADYARNPETQAWVASMVDLCRRLDPTRPVEDNSACDGDHVETDLNTWHFYTDDPARARALVGQAVEGTFPGSGWNFVPGRVQGRQPLLNSEYGGVGAHGGDRDVSFSLKWLTELLRAQEKVTGFVYTELTDVEWEHNGLLRYDRLPKEFPYALADVLGPDALVVDGPPILEAEPGAAPRLRVFASVWSLPDGEGSLRWQLEGTDGEGRHVHGWGGQAPAAWRRYRVVELPAPAVRLPDRAGLYRLDLALHDAAGRRVARTYADVLAGEPAGGMPDLEVRGFRATHARGEYWVGEGPGEVRFALAGQGRTLVLEAAAGVFQPRQTDPARTPSVVRVALDGRPAGAFRLPDAPADARGVLSYAAGLPGPYGYLLRVPLPAEPAGTGVRVTLSCDAGGLALFGPRAGRYPLGPRLV